MRLTGVLECVANVSEGRNREVVDALASACAAALLDVHADADHHRSVFTLAGAPDMVENAARRLAEGCLLRIDLSQHEGVHPRLGALDVVPFVALDAADHDHAVETARRFAGWLGGTLEIPAFLYGDADPLGRPLPDVRREAFVTRLPDFGPAEPHATAGATKVGVRPALAAMNCNLATADVEIAQAIAATVRERDGGLSGVRALGFNLATRNCAQVSMNLVDLDATGVETACTTVREHARSRGTDVVDVELVGLLPVAELERCSGEFRAWAGLDASATIEARLAARETAF